MLASALNPCYHQPMFLSDSQWSIAYTALKEKVKAIQSQSEGKQTQQSDTRTFRLQAAKNMTALAFLLEEDIIEEIPDIQ